MPESEVLDCAILANGGSVEALLSYPGGRYAVFGCEVLKESE